MSQNQISDKSSEEDKFLFNKKGSRKNLHKKALVYTNPPNDGTNYKGWSKHALCVITAAMDSLALQQTFLIGLKISSKIVKENRENSHSVVR